MDGADPSNLDTLLNQSHDSKVLYNDPSNDNNSPNSLDNDDTGGADSTDNEPEEELLGDITIEDFASIMNRSSVESPRARLALLLMLLIMVDEEDTCKRQYHKAPFTGSIRVQYYLNGHDKDIKAYKCTTLKSFLCFCRILRDRMLLSDMQYMTVEEQLFIFMCVVCQITSNTNLADVTTLRENNITMVRLSSTCYLYIKKRIF